MNTTRRLGIAAVLLCAVALLTPSVAFGDGVSVPAPPPTGAGALGNVGNGGGALSCSTVDGPCPIGASGYDQWDGRYISTDASAYGALCPTGWDVWRFYGSSSNPPKITYSSTSRITLFNYDNCKAGNSINPAFASVPNPADLTGNLPDGNTAQNIGQLAHQVYDAQGRAIPEFPFISGPSYNAFGLPVYKVNSPVFSSNPIGYDAKNLNNTGGYYTTGNTFEHGGSTSCSSLQTSPDQARKLFASYASYVKSPSTSAPVSQDAQNWVKNFWGTYGSNTSAAHSSYLYWLTNPASPGSSFPPNAAFADYMMNINPTVTLAQLGIGPNWTPTATTWSVLATNYGTGVPACSSSYQYVPNQQSDGTIPAQAIMGECIIPFDRAATPWTISVVKTPQAGYTTITGRNFNGNDLLSTYSAGGSRYAPLSGNLDVYAPTTPTYTTTMQHAAHTAWRHAIANEVGHRLFGGSFYSIGQHYLYNNPNKYNVGLTNFYGAIADASTGSMCIDAPAPSAPVPNPVAPTGTPSQTISVPSTVLAAGGSLNYQTVAATLGQFYCVACQPSGVTRTPVEGPISVQMTFSASNGYKSFWLVGAYGSKINPVAGPNNTWVINAPLTQGISYQLGFLKATSPTQKLTVTVTKASSSVTIYTSDTCQNTSVTTNGVTVTKCVYQSRTQAFNLTIGSAGVDTVVDGIAHG